MTDCGTLIQVHLTRKTYAPGELISGVVIFKPSQSNDKLHLEVYGRESVGWVDTISYSVQGWNQTYIEERKDESRIFQSTLLIELPSELDTKKSYKIGFSFELPINIPGSGFEVNGFGISYRVRAYNAIDRIKSIADIHVIQPPIFTNRLTVKSKNQLKFCCTQRGDISTRFTLDKPFYHPGDIAQITPVILNNSKGIIRHVEMKLRSVTVMHANGKSKTLEKTIQEERSEWTDETREFSFQLPSDLAQCAFGNIYSNYYVLDIHVNISAGWGPTCSIPVILTTSQPESEKPPIEVDNVSHLSPVMIKIPQSAPTCRWFTLKIFPNVSEMDSTRGSQLWKSASRMMRSFTTLSGVKKSSMVN